MSGFGFIIIQTLVNDIIPAAKVKDAMNEINGKSLVSPLPLLPCCLRCQPAARRQLPCCLPLP